MMSPLSPDRKRGSTIARKPGDDTTQKSDETKKTEADEKKKRNPLLVSINVLIRCLDQNGENTESLDNNIFYDPSDLIRLIWR